MYISLADYYKSKEIGQNDFHIYVIEPAYRRDMATRADCATRSDGFTIALSCRPKLDSTSHVKPAYVIGSTKYDYNISPYEKVFKPSHIQFTWWNRSNLHRNRKKYVTFRALIIHPPVTHQFNYSFYRRRPVNTLRMTANILSSMNIHRRVFHNTLVLSIYVSPYFSAHGSRKHDSIY